MSEFEDVNRLRVPSRQNKALIEAIKSDDINTMRQLLNTPGVNVNYVFTNSDDSITKYYTALKCAIRHGNYDIVELLFIQYW